jgi:hypothetical protein
MSYIERLNTRSTEHTGDLVLPFDQDRGYFFIVMTTGTGTIEFGGGGGKIPLAEGYVLEPNVCPISEISIETVGTYVIHMG